MSLGKGLESLIPPQQQPDGASQSSPQLARDSSPQQSSSQPAPYTSSNAPVEPRKEELHREPPQEFKREVVREESPRTAPLGLSPVREEPVIKPMNREVAVFQIEIEKIKPNPHQPRKVFDDDAIKDLAASIREFGLLQPIVVTKVEHEVPTGTEVEYFLISGERRLLASRSLGMPRIPAIIRSVGFERERLELAIIENIQRENLNPVELARAYSRLQDEFRMTQREVASRLGKSREAVANTMRLLDLPSYIQDAVSKGEISESHGRLLLAIPEPATQEKIFRDLVDRKLTTRELKSQVDRMHKPRETGRLNLTPELKMFEDRLTSQLGAPVHIAYNGDSGKITITYYSEEELKNIMGRLSKEEPL